VARTGTAEHNKLRADYDYGFEYGRDQRMDRPRAGRTLRRAAPPRTWDVESVEGCGSDARQTGAKDPCPNVKSDTTFERTGRASAIVDG
jgi:hypothetical protein